jgi:hypothetical protein
MSTIIPFESAMPVCSACRAMVADGTDGLCETCREAALYQTNIERIFQALRDEGCALAQSHPDATFVSLQFRPGGVVRLYANATELNFPTLAAFAGWLLDPKPKK